jgi:hypothetical protein
MILVASLVFARNAIVVTIHLCARTVLEEKMASLQEVICEQLVRPSHLKALVDHELRLASAAEYGLEGFTSSAAMRCRATLS